MLTRMQMGILFKLYLDTNTPVDFKTRVLAVFPLLCEHEIELIYIAFEVQFEEWFKK